MKKTILLFLALCIALPVFSGCGGDGESSSQTASSKEYTEDDAFAGLKFTPDANLDLGGKEMTFAVWGVVPDKTTPKYKRRYDLMARTEEKYNVKINWIASDIGNFIKDYTLSYTAGKKYADVMFAPSYDGFGVCKLEGSVLALDDYIDYGNARYARAGNNLLYVDGRHYSWMPDEISANSLGYSLTYNTTLLESAGCSDPMELYRQGKWNWDSFIEIVEKTTVIQNGEAIQWGIGGSNLLDGIMASNEVTPIIMNTKEHKFESGFYTDAGQNALNFLRKITYELKGSDNNYGGHNSKINFEDSKLAMLIGPQYYTPSFVLSGMPIGTVPLPKGPDAGGYVNALELQEWWMLPKISDFTPEQVLQVCFDSVQNDPKFEDTYVSVEGEKNYYVIQTYDENVFNTEEESEFFYDFMKSDKVKTFLNISTSDSLSMIAKDIYEPLSNGETPRALLERIKPVLDTALEKMK